MVEYEERRNDDKRKEQIVREFLELHLYNKFPDYIHNESAETQKLGVDCEFTGKNFHYVVDEKAVTGSRYINDGMQYPNEKNPRKRLNTFCLELSMRTKSNGNWIRCDGWWLSDKVINNSLVLTWIDRTKSGNIENVDDILEAEVIVVRKEELYKYLNSLGWTKEKLKTQLNEIITEFDKWDGTKTINGLKFNVPFWLKGTEAPVNILITREIYRDISDFNKVFKLD